MLADHGHEVRVFAMDYPDNDTIPDAAGYASRVDFGGGSSAKLRASARLFGKGDIVKSASEVLDSFPSRCGASAQRAFLSFAAYRGACP